MGAISPAADVDYYRINGVPAGSLLFTFTDTGIGPTNDSTGNSNDTQMDVLAADGSTSIEFDDDDGTPNGGDSVIDSANTYASAVAGRELTAGGTGSIGIGMPGSLSPVSGLVQNANSTWLNGKA